MTAASARVRSGSVKGRAGSRSPAGSTSQRCSVVRAVEQPAIEGSEPVAGGAGISENRVDPARRAANGSDAVQGVPPAEQRQGAGLRVEGAYGFAGALEHCPHRYEVLVVGGSDPGNVLELAARVTAIGWVGSKSPSTSCPKTARGRHDAPDLTARQRIFEDSADFAPHRQNYD